MVVKTGLTSDQLKRLQELEILRKGLPHLFGHKFYQWQKLLIDSRNPLNFTCAANQVGKSTANIVKAIRWATESSLWPTLWSKRPTQFWYFYPSRSTTQREFDEKWVKDYLPRDGYKDSAEFGWVADYFKKEVQKLRFNSGVTIYFFSYEQSPHNLQASTVDAVFTDEETPFEHFNELMPRLSHGGYYSTVFTPTIGQEYLREIIEERGANEKLPSALKQQITLFDCLTYTDGSPSTIWNEEKIRRQIEKYPTEAEINKRVYGKFVKAEGLLYPTFSRSKNVVPFVQIPPEWLFWSGTDSGSGGRDNHPAAIVFVAVSPDYTEGVVFKCWRGDGQITTADDTVRKHKQLGAGLRLVQAKYDYAGSGKDVGIIGVRSGLPFTRANKDRTTGIKLLNALFKSGMLRIMADESSFEENKLIHELSTVTMDAKKTRAKDDLSDALRYAVADIPWNFKINEHGKRSAPDKRYTEVNERIRFYRGYNEHTGPSDTLISDILDAEDFYGVGS